MRPSDRRFYGHFLELPTGQLMFTDFSSDVEIFTPKGTYKAAWQPTITSVPSTITHGKSYVVKGTQLSGLTNGAAYGDDFQDSTNYALVRITNTASKHVVYAKTTNPSTFAVQTRNHGGIDQLRCAVDHRDWRQHFGSSHERDPVRRRLSNRKLVCKAVATT